MTTTEPPPRATTAAVVLRAGECSPQCLVAVEPGCDCRCGGRLHGALTTSRIPTRKEGIGS